MTVNRVKLPAGKYMFKVNIRNTRTRYRSSNFIVNFDHISHLVLVFLLITLSRQRPAGLGRAATFGKYLASVLSLYFYQKL